MFPVVSDAQLQGVPRSHFIHCKERYYLKHSKDKLDFCRPFICPITVQLFGIKPCDCHEPGSEAGNCDAFGGECTCKMNVDGRKCNICDRLTWGLSSSGCQRK